DALHPFGDDGQAGGEPGQADGFGHVRGLLSGAAANGRGCRYKVPRADDQTVKVGPSIRNSPDAARAEGSAVRGGVARGSGAPPIAMTTSSCYNLTSILVTSEGRYGHRQSSRSESPSERAVGQRRRRR